MAIGTTKLDAVNAMLSAISEAPVNTLAGSGLVEVAIALQKLEATNRAVQLRGWRFNTETNYPITPTVGDGFLLLPPNTLAIAPCGCDEGRVLVDRGGKLYDAENHTYKFTKTVRFTLTTLLDFEDLPAAAKNYVTIRAARQFQDSVQGSQEINGFQVADEKQAWEDLLSSEARAENLRIRAPNYGIMRWRSMT